MQQAHIIFTFKIAFCQVTKMTFPSTERKGAVKNLQR